MTEEEVEVTLEEDVDEISPEEYEEINKKTKEHELELDGSINLVYLDENRNVLLKEELDPETVLKAITSVLTDAVRVYNALEQDEEEVEEDDEGPGPELIA
jgi:hypothetical protein